MLWACLTELVLGLGSCSCVYSVREHSRGSFLHTIPKLTLQEGSASWLLFLDFISLLKFIHYWEISA